MCFALVPQKYLKLNEGQLVGMHSPKLFVTEMGPSESKSNAPPVSIADNLSIVDV
jgi:hypothetical protein